MVLVRTMHPIHMFLSDSNDTTCMFLSTSWFSTMAGVSCIQNRVSTTDNYKCADIILFRHRLASDDIDTTTAGMVMAMALPPFRGF